MANKRKPSKKRRSHILAIVSENDPCRFRTRTVKPEKGKGHKNRPRNNAIDDFFDCAA